MSNLKEFLRQYPQETQRILGINAEQLETLTEIAKEKYQEKKKQKPRLIKVGGGREEKLSLEEQIILTLFYLHNNFPNFRFSRIEFGVSESTGYKIFHEWVELLEELLPPFLMEQKRKEYRWIISKTLICFGVFFLSGTVLYLIFNVPDTVDVPPPITAPPTRFDTVEVQSPILGRVTLEYTEPDSIDDSSYVRTFYHNFSNGYVYYFHFESPSPRVSDYPRKCNSISVQDAVQIVESLRYLNSLPEQKVSDPDPSDKSHLKSDSAKLTPDQISLLLDTKTSKRVEIIVPTYIPQSFELVNLRTYDGSYSLDYRNSENICFILRFELF